MIKKLFSSIYLFSSRQNQNPLEIIKQNKTGNFVNWLCLGMFFVVSFVNAATYTSSQSGNWNSPVTWGGFGIPTTGDIVIIGSHTITVTANAACSSIDFNGNNPAISISTGVSLTVGNTTSGSIVVNSSNSSSRTVSISGLGTLTCYNLSVGNNATPSSTQTTVLISTVANFNILENLVLVSRRTTSPTRTNNATFELQSGILNIDGQITTNNQSSGVTSTFTMLTGVQTGTLLLSNTNPFNLSANTTNIINLNGTGATVNYDGGAQTVGTYIYNNLTLSGSGAKTFAVTSVTNNFTLSGTATATTAANLAVGGGLNIGTGTSLTTGNDYALVVTGTTSVTGTLTLGGNATKTFTGDVTVNSGGTWNETAAATINFVGNLTNNGALTASTGIHTFSGASKTISGTNGIAIPNLTINGTTTNSGTLTVSTALSGSSTLTNGATAVLNIGGTSGITTLTATATGNTVNYNGAAQTVKATTYSNLTLLGSGTKSFGATTTVSANWSIASGVLANLGGFTHTAGTLVLGGAGPLLNSWGSVSSGAINTTNDYFTGTGIINVSSAPYPAIDNNYASYSNGVSGQVAGTIGEYGGSLVLTAPAGATFTNVKFASYGLPGGTSPNFTIGTCHAFNSRTVTTGLLGNNTATIPASGSFNATFGDPCNGTVKSYNVVATYSEPFCTTSPVSSIFIDGTTPTGGNGTYSFLWEKSITGHSSGYAAAPGINNTEDYNVAAGTSQTTWYRRTVTSGIYSDATIVIVQVVTVAPTVPTTITAPTTTYCGASTTLTVSGGSLGGPGGYAEWTTNSCGGTVVGTGNSITVSPTTTTTYYVKYRNACGSTTCLSTTITMVSPSITPNKIDESCSLSNNGSISPVLSGGLSNVRYIKLTQKYADYQQVAEIQAFEIFTGTNLALSSGGAVASSSSVWTNSTGPNYIPSNVNNGVTTGTTFWHSATGNINEWVQIDLQSGKNIDYLRFYNRTDCCSNRGQNMLLELFDASNNLLLSKNIDLYQSGANVLDVNVLDVSWTDSATTLNRTGLDSGTYTLNFADTNGCSTSSSINITATSVNPTAPTIGTITQPTCVVTTASVDLSDLPSSGSWTITATPATAGLTGLTGTNTATTTVGGLTANTSYTFIVDNGTCSSIASASAVTNTVPATATWNGTAWTGTTPAGSNPLITQPIIITGNYTSSGDINGCSCAITSGNVIISSGDTLTITNGVSVTNNVTTSLTFENNASLLQTNNIANTGFITYKRVSQPMRNFDYTYWSSPVVGQTLYNLSPNTLWDKYYSFSGTDWSFESSSNVMEKGIGYIIRTPKPNFWPNPMDPTYSQPVEFIGIPNNGNITSTQSMVTGNFYLIGNPYPSALDADDFLITNTNNHTVLNGTIYFWTHNTQIQQNGSFYQYTSNDYASYNQTGGTAASGANNSIPDGYIAAGQSFFASAKANGTVEFNNTMRQAGNNTQFFKPGKSSKSSGLEKNRLWLNMTNTAGAFKQTLIGYIGGATNAYDSDFDGVTFDGNTYIDFYSVNAADNLVIQGRALPFNDADTVPLGYRSTIAGNFTIAIDKADGVLATQKIYLEDKVTNTISELTAKNYTFTTKIGTFDNRFVLRYTNNTLGTGDFETKEEAVTVAVLDKIITINSTKENINKVFIYDISGKLLHKKQAVGNSQLVLQNLPFAQQVLLVKVVLENGSDTTKKVIFK